MLIESMEKPRDPKQTTLFEGLDEVGRKVLAALPRDVQGELDAFFRRVKVLQFLEPDRPPNPEWKLFRGKTWVEARSLAKRATRDTRIDATKDAAELAALEAASRSGRIAAWPTAGNLGSGSTRNLDLDAINFVGLAAGWDAALYARYLMVSDLNFPDKDKHWEHVKKCWEVWEKGYALFGDVDGKLYVYCPNDEPDDRSFIRRILRI